MIAINPGTNQQPPGSEILMKAIKIKQKHCWSDSVIWFHYELLMWLMSAGWSHLKAAETLRLSACVCVCACRDTNTWQDFLSAPPALRGSWFSSQSNIFRFYSIKYANVHLNVSQRSKTDRNIFWTESFYVLWRHNSSSNRQKNLFSFLKH